MKAAIVGGGVIGGGWAARFLLHGWDIVVTDPNPEVRTQVDEILTNAGRSLPALSDVAMPRRGNLTFTNSLSDAVVDADWVQESVPEDLETKHRVFAEIQANAPARAILGSSTSGFKPSQLQYDEVGVDEPYYTTVQILLADAKRLHVFYRMHAGKDDRLLATLEAVYLHVDMATSKVVVAKDAALHKLLALAKDHATLDKPDSAGRFVG